MIRREVRGDPYSTALTPINTNHAGQSDSDFPKVLPLS